MRLFRAMKADGDKPAVEPSARGLGVRVGGPYPDVVLDADGNAEPGQGMSVAPEDPMFLKQHRRPEELGGTGPDPVWEIDDDVIVDPLHYLQQSGTHGVIEPSTPTHITAFQANLASTRDCWGRTT